MDQQTMQNQDQQASFEQKKTNATEQQSMQIETSENTASIVNPTINQNIPQSTMYSSDLPPRNNEVQSHYLKRKAVYEKVLNDLKDHQKAVCYSNIWSNMTYLKSVYSEQLTEKVMKYSVV